MDWLRHFFEPTLKVRVISISGSFMSQEHVMVDFGSALTVSNAADLHQKLQTALTHSTTVMLKADAIEKVDTAGLQLCVALHCEVAKLSGQVLWYQPSEVLAQGAKTLGLTQFIGLEARL